MLGTTARHFAPLGARSLEDLVPSDHFYRQLDQVLDLSFVRDLVAPCYAVGGRPSIDPVVFFHLQLVLFFEGLRSERLLIRVLADRLAARWYVGHDLGEALPDRSSLSKIRQRDGVRLGYQAHYVVDGGKARIILAALVTPAEVPEDGPAAAIGGWGSLFGSHGGVPSLPVVRVRSLIGPASPV